MDISKKILYKNIIFYFFGILVGGFINFFSIPVIIEIYGVESYGQFSLIQNIVLIIISFGSGWLSQNILRFNDNSSTFKVNIILLYYITILPILIISLFSIVLIKYNLTIAVISSLTIAIGGITAIINSFYQSTFNAKKNVFFDIFRVTGFIFCVYLFSKIKGGDLLTYLVISFFFSYLIAFVLKIKNDFILIRKVFFIYIRNIKQKTIIKVFKRNLNFLHYGLPLSLWFTFSSILNVGDRYTIDLFIDKSAVGNYSAIYDLIYKGVSISFTPILSAGYPIISKLYNQGKVAKAFDFIYKLIFFEVLILVIGVFTLSYFNLDKFFLEKIVRLQYSDTNAKLVLLILIGAIIWQIAMLVHKPLELKLKTKQMLLFVTIALIFNLLFNFLLVPQYGTIMSGYATIISASIYLLLCFSYSFFKI